MARIRAFVAIMLLLVIGGLAKGQSYHVRVEGDTNLRDANSLAGNVIETIPSGTVLPVILWAENWLKVVRGRRRLWMADWVNYTLVELSDNADGGASIATESAPPTQTETCCALEWQCSNERTRVSAAWAHRFGRCHVETTYLKQNYRVYNCCFLSGLCFTDKAWRDGYSSFQSHQCEVRSVEITGSDEFRRLLHQAFAMLKDQAPVWYAYAISGLNAVTEIPDSHHVGVDTRTAHFRASLGALQYDAPDLANIVWTASVLAHEACHVHLRAAKLFPATGTSAAEEKLCTEVQLIVVETMDPAHYISDYLQTLIDNVHNPHYQWW